MPVERSLVMIGSPTLTYAQQAGLREELLPNGELLAFRSDGAVSLDDGTPRVPLEIVSENYFAPSACGPLSGGSWSPATPPGGPPNPRSW